MKRSMLALCLAVTTIGVASAQTGAPMTNGVGAADNTNSKSAPPLQTWMSDYSRSHQGYISRQAYMDEMGRRWDAMDRNQRGLTVDQINSTYGYQPNPGMTHAQTNATNPSGTERQGQNSGGK